ncbi:hypothetical protein ANO11243_042370 [Dothideomycetidae sp. 11243]|nr:hypothetical protein ANO11243_042370 [fungal sp. No.11243]
MPAWAGSFKFTIWSRRGRLKMASNTTNPESSVILDSMDAIVEDISGKQGGDAAARPSGQITLPPEQQKPANEADGDGADDQCTVPGLRSCSCLLEAEDDEDRCGEDEHCSEPIKTREGNELVSTVMLGPGEEEGDGRDLG